MRSIMPEYQRQLFIDTYTVDNVRFKFASNILRQAYILGWRFCANCVVLVKTNDRTCLICKKQYRTTLNNKNRGTIKRRYKRI